MVKSTHNTRETVKDIWILSQHLMELNLNLNKSWGNWELERATRPSAALQVVSASLWKTFFKPERASSQLAENQNRNQEHKQEQLFSPKSKAEKLYECDEVLYKYATEENCEKEVQYEEKATTRVYTTRVNTELNERAQARAMTNAEQERNI